MRKILLSLVCLVSFLMNGQKQTQSIGFIENKGQIIDQKGRKNTNVKYLLNSNGLNVQLRQNGFSYDIYEIKKHPLTKKQKERLYPSNFIEEDTLKNPNYSSEYIYHRIDIDFKKSNISVQLIADEKSSDYDNYYNIPNEPNGILDVHKFQKVTYENIYNNIDVIFFVPEDKTKPVEYNFIVKPNGNIDDIQLEFKGTKTELVDNKIKMNVRFGQMEETLPLSWTENGIDKNEITVGYKKIKNNIYGFESNNDLIGKRVIIDPTPVRLWGTYYGGSGNEFAGSINIDTNNNLIISGSTSSSNNIATSGSNTSGYFNGGAFIAKFSPNGQRVWASYYPFGTNKLKLDHQNNMYVYGSVLYDNPDIITIGCYQSVKDNYTSGYLIKLNSDGSKQWGTYYGGNHNEDLNNLAIDDSGNVYLVGATNSTDCFASLGAFQTIKNSPGSYQTGFIAKFDSTGNRVWGTFYGGNLADGFFDINISTDGYLYAIGTHNSLNDITTLGTFQPLSNVHGGMIIKFDLNGNRIWGTFIADNSYLFRGRLKGNNIILSGRTSSNELGTPGTMSENLIIPLPSGSGLITNENNFIIKFNIQTQQYIWGTYFPEQIIGVDLDSSDNIFFSGSTLINSGLTTPDGYMSIKNNYSKSYLVKLNSIGQKIWGTYYGGNLAEQLGLVKIDSNNDIYLYGNTNGSTTGIASVGANQTTLGSNPDTYIAKFKDCLSSTITTSNSPTCIGTTLNLTASGGTNYSWTGPNGFISNLQNPTISNANTSHSGQYFCLITGTGGCDGTNTINVVVGDTEKPIPNINPLPTITGDCNTTITAPIAIDNCTGNLTATTTDSLAFTLPGNYTINWKYDDGNGNIETQTQTVTITSVALPTVSSSQNFCIQQNATLNSIVITGQNIKWYDAATSGNLLPSATTLINGITYYASQTINGCESLRSPVTINIQNTFAPTGNATHSFCSTQNATLSDIVISGTSIKWYNSATSTTLLPITTTLFDGSTYYATQTINGCESVGRLAVTISLINTLNATDYSETLCDNLNDGFETINLINYQSNLITNATGCTFEYYNSQNGANNQVATDQIITPSNYNLTVGAHTLFVRITSINTCHQVVKLNLELVKKPIISLNDIIPICQNTSITINSGNGFDSYLWSTGATTSSIVVSQVGNYYLTVTQNHGSIVCSSTKNFQVLLSNIATILNIETIDMSSDNENIIMVNLDTNSLGDYEYSIDGIHYQDSNTFTNLSGRDYIVYVRDKNGCGIINNNVFLLTYPKFFSPNNDGYNDTWKINFSEVENGLTVNIFDRYGKLLKTLDNKTAWDGTYNNNMMISDDYWFVVHRANGKEHRGHFTLKR